MKSPAEEFTMDPEAKLAAIEQAHKAELVAATEMEAAHEKYKEAKKKWELANAEVGAVIDDGQGLLPLTDDDTG